MKFWVQLQLCWMNIIIKESYVFGFGQLGEIFHMLYIISSFLVPRSRAEILGSSAQKGPVGLGPVTPVLRAEVKV